MHSVSYLQNSLQAVVDHSDITNLNMAKKETTTGRISQQLKQSFVP